MSWIRWQKISEALAGLGHDVDIVTNESRWDRNPTPLRMGERLSRVPLKGRDWSQYDVVKTLFHGGFDLLEEYGGSRHPFIISKLGSVVGPEDMPGIYFYGDIRRRLYNTQVRIHRTSRYVTVLSEAARELWRQTHGERKGMLLVPGGVDHELPDSPRNPFQDFKEKVCLFSGNIYDADSQPEANRVIVEKLNRIGRLLQGSGIRLCFQGTGDTSRLDEAHVTNLGSTTYDNTWAYFLHAAVGLVVSAGDFMQNNESTKIYHYLRAGLPVVSEAGFPNDDVVVRSGLGFVVRNGDMELMARRIREAASAAWDRERAKAFILDHHTWRCRAEVYRDLLPKRAAGWAARQLRRVRIHAPLP